MVENQKITVIDSEVICNQQVNVYGTREKPLFLAKDVAKWLGHSNPSKMISKIDDDEKMIIYAKLNLQNSDISDSYIPSESDSYKANNYLSLLNLAFTKS